MYKSLCDSDSTQNNHQKQAPKSILKKSEQQKQMQQDLNETMPYGYDSEEEALQCLQQDLNTTLPYGFKSEEEAMQNLGQLQQQKKVRFKRLSKPNSNKQKEKLILMYTNLDGIKGKVKDLEQTAQSLNADGIMVTETKQIPPRLKGYGRWRSKERTTKGGGGVAICFKEHLDSRITKRTDLEDEDQDVVWVDMKVGHKKKVIIGTYYGKQEKENAEVIEKEYSQLDTQLTKLEKEGPCILGGDFNAKLEINEENHKQSITTSGKHLKKLKEKHQLEHVSLKSEPGKWTWENRANPQQKSIIDYVFMTPEIAKNVTRVHVDEEAVYRIKGKSKTDHNTIIVELEINIQKEKKQIKKWNINNKTGWENFNKEFKRRHKNNKPINSKEMQKLITSTMRYTIGQTTINVGDKRSRESDKVRQLRKDRKQARKEFESALKNDRNKVEEKLKTYIEKQKQLKQEIEIETKEKTKSKLSKYAKEGASKTIKFWKQKNDIEKEKVSEPYDTMKENGEIIEEPEEAREHIAQYYENLYQARPSKENYKEITKQIENKVKEIEKEMENKPKIEDFTAKELEIVIKKLKRKKAIGPDEIPNELFIEADEDTKNIYREHFNSINQTMEIPDEWQEGNIKRLYKGKGDKGKCSNERGITISSNYGKVYERLINERVLKKVNISDNQAGGKKGAATVDHIVLAKEILNEIKKQKKNADTALLDVTKAYDKAWLTGIMEVLYKQGLTDNHWTIVKKLNENLTAKIQTKYGYTRMIQILDSIRQGGVLSTTMYGAIMDEVSKELEKEKQGIIISENGAEKGSLLWVDDVFLIAMEGELQKPLDITDEISSKYHIEYGKPKSNSLPIKTSKKKIKEKAYSLGEMELERTDKYKYLGYIQNSKNNNDEHIKAVKSRTEAAYQQMMALAGNSSFENIEMEAIWTVLRACITPAITYSGEAWEPTKKNYKEANQIMDGVLKRILKTPTHGTSREAIYIETGLLDPEAIILKNRINMEGRIRNGNNETMKTILLSKTTGSWAQDNNKIKERLGLTEDEIKNNRYALKEIAKTKVKDDFKTRINAEMDGKSKMNYFMEGKKEWQPLKPAEYTQKLSRNQVSNIFKARTRMLKVRSNYKNGHKEHKCRLCNANEETQQHVLEQCEKLDQYEKITKEMIFDENVENLRITAGNIQIRMEKLEEQQG